MYVALALACVVGLSVSCLQSRIQFGDRHVRVDQVVDEIDDQVVEARKVVRPGIYSLEEEDLK